MEREFQLTISPAQTHILNLPLASQDYCLPELSLPIREMGMARLSMNVCAICIYPVACVTSSSTEPSEC